MIFARSVLIAWLVVCAQLAWAGPRANVQVVFDLDWTLIYPITNEQAALETESVVKFGNEFFRLSDHAIAAVAYLHAAGFDVSYFSGEMKDRNLAVIDFIYAKLQEQYADVGAKSWRPFAIGDVGDLEPFGNDPNARFAERLKKNIARWQPNADLTRTVLVEDMQQFAPPPKAGEVDQRRGLLWLQETFESILDHDAWSESTPPETRTKYHPPSRERWAIERNKIVWALGVIVSARELADSKGVVFQDALVSLTRSGDSLIPLSEPSQLRLTEKGLSLLGLPASATERHVAPNVTSCGNLQMLNAAASGI